MDTRDFSDWQVICMAVGKYISVYDSVDGPKLRKLSKTAGCSKGEALGLLLFLWKWGRENTSQTGEILEADRTDIAGYLAYADTGSSIDFSLFVDALIECGWIDEIDEKLYIHDWQFWQSNWFKAVERKKKDVDRKRKTKLSQEQDDDNCEGDELFPLPSGVETISGDADTPIGEIGDGGEGVPPTPPPPEPKKGKNNYSKPFEEFWKAYPRSIDKGNAYLKYQARRKDGYSEDELLAAAKNYAAECKRKGTEKEFIKHPKTFLSETLPFTDYLPKEPQTSFSEPQSGNPFQKYGGHR